MKVIKAVKKIAAITTAVSMVGATIMGAAAADLNEYPFPFIQDGIYSGHIVVGDKAAAEDVVGAIDVQASLQANAVVPAGTYGPGGISIQGDVVEIGEPNDLLELYERIGDVRETLTETYLDGLRSGIISTDEGVTDYNQYLRFEDNATTTTIGTIQTGSVVFEEDEDDVVGHYLMFKDNEIVFEYELEFEEGVESEMLANTAGGNVYSLKDLEDEELVMLGVPFSVINTRVDLSEQSIKLDLLGGDVLDTLEEGQTKTYTIDGVDYEVTVLIISDSTRTEPAVKFNVNGEITDEMEDGETDILRDGTEIGIREILANEANEVSGGDIVEFYLGSNKIELTDSNFTYNELDGDFEFDGTVEIGNENIEDASVNIFGRNRSDVFTIHSIKYRLTSDGVDGDVHIPPGGRLSEYLDEPQGMLTDNWNIAYQGLHDTGVSIIRLDASGDDAYKLRFTNREGQDYNVPFIDNSDDESLGFKYGDDDDDLVFIEGCVADVSLFAPGVTDNFNIQENDNFVLTDDNDETGFTHIVKYESIDESTQLLTFTDLATGQLEVTYDGTEGTDAFGELIVGGNTFNVYVDDATGFPIAVDQDDNNIVNGDCDGDGSNAGEGALDSNSGNVDAQGNMLSLNDDKTGEANIVVDGGGILDLGYTNNISADTNAYVTLTTLGQEFDENGPNDWGDTGVGPAWGNEVITVNISQSGTNEVDLRVLNTYINSSGNTSYDNDIGADAVPVVRMQSISDEDLRQGLSLYGVFLEQSDDEQDNADELIIEYPLFQRGAQVFVTIGDTVVSSAGEGGAATIVNPISVGSAKLASEVAGRETSSNLIVVGGPCINSVAAKLMGSDEPLCGEASGISEGTAIIKLYENGNNVALVVAGYSAADTRRATTVLAGYKNYQLSGMEVEVTGTSMSDITVSAPMN